MTADQTERGVLTLRYIESQPDSGPHKPAMPGHIAVERGIEVVARLPIPDGLAPAPTPRTVTTVEELRALEPGTIVKSASGTVACLHPSGVGTVFGDERPFRWDALALPATILAPAIDPDDDALVERVASEVGQAIADHPAFTGPWVEAEFADLVRLASRAALKAATA